MQIDNFKRVAKITIAYGVLLIIFIVLFLFSFFEPYYRNIYLVLAGVFFAVYLFLLLSKPHFFSLEEKNSTLIIRFYNPHPFVGNYRQIKIPIQEFDGYEVRRGLFGQRLVFKIRRGKQTGHYPPLSITALNKEEKLRLFDYLDKIKPQE